MSGSRRRTSPSKKAASRPVKARSGARGGAQASSRIVETLLASDEPSIVYKVRERVLGEDPASGVMRMLREEIRSSPRVKRLLSRLDRDGRFKSFRHVYDKWQGAHWVFASLAELGYPKDAPELSAMAEQLLDTWLAPEFYEEYEASGKAAVYARKSAGVPLIAGRYRRCASQQGYLLFALVQLELGGGRVHHLVERLAHWRWPDGGWNCDKRAEAHTSTFIHTIHALRGLAAYSSRFPKGDGQLKASGMVKDASEYFLCRELFKRRSTGEVVRNDFIQLHYPRYWHYDVLLGLEVMRQIGGLADPRCQEALDLLESKRLPDGGWPAEASFHTVSQTFKRNADSVEWGGTSKKKMNPWVTAEALGVLAAAGRFE